jgi:hypothetical protein
MSATSATPTTVGPTGSTAICPFTFGFSAPELGDLRRRIAATRLPDTEPVDDASERVQLATIQAIAQHLSDGTMPCDGAWPAEQVERFQSWVKEGARR